MINEENLKQIISKNLIKYRKINGLTQMELAIELNYSDKAISKWERGESIPDIFVLSLIADFYHISVGDLITEQSPEKQKLHRIEKIISLFSAVVVWAVATIIFVFFHVSKYNIDRPWLAFIYALPISILVLICFGKKWNSEIYELFTSSGFVWTLSLSLHLTLYPVIENIWMIYLAAIPLQLILAIWYILRVFYHKK